MKALLIGDIQNDFVPGGALAVPEGDRVVPVINRLQPAFELIIAIQDWHPRSHGSFAANHPGKKPGDIIDLNGLKQVLWPVHCVQDTTGAEFVPRLDTSRVSQVFRKGTDPGIDSYSAFFDNGHLKATGLGDYLKERKVEEVFLTGLATDYCVKFSALDAVELGFNTRVVVDATRGINLHPDDVGKAIAEMERAGVKMVRSDEILK